MCGPQHRTHGTVGVGWLDLFRECDRWRDDKKWNPYMSGANDEAGSNGQVAFGTPLDGFLHPDLDGWTKKRIELKVKTAVHESKAVGRGDNALLRAAEDVSMAHLDIRKPAECIAQCRGNVLV